MLRMRAYERRSAILNLPRLTNLVLAAWLTAAASAQPAVPSQWSAALAEPLRLMFAGDLDRSASLALSIGETASESTLRHEAQAVQALALLLREDRPARVQGRALLMQLESQSAGLVQRAESQYALGVAATELGETAVALTHLETAVGQFEAQADHPRQAAALVALARAWGRHSEWQTTPMRFIPAQPETPDEALAIRMAKVQEQRTRLARLPDVRESLAELDLLLADMQLADPPNAQEGRGTLKRLASEAPLTRGGARAAMRLGRQADLEDEWAAAEEWYERVAHSPDESLATDARNALRALSRAQLRCSLQTDGQHVQVHVNGRRMSRIALEIRSLDLADWLGSSRGHLLEVHLPESGAVRASHEITAGPGGDAEGVLEAQLAAGAYVVLARGEPGAGADGVVKRLLLVDPLPVTALIGIERGVLALTDARDHDAGAEVEFWMQGGFVPLRFPLRDGVGDFDLPPEARLLVQKRWTCLIRVGSRFGLLSGQLAEEDPGGSQVRAVLLAGSPGDAAAGGAPLTGVLLNAVGARDASWNRPLRVELRDARDQLFVAAQAQVHAGAFAMEIPIGDDVLPERLHVQLRDGARPIPLIGHRADLQLGRELLPAWFDGGVPERQRPDDLELPIRLEARYPWGRAIEHGNGQLALLAIGLPQPTSGVAEALRSFSDHVHLSDRGVLNLKLPLPLSFKGSAPLVLRTVLSVGDDGTTLGALEQEILMADEPALAWVIVEPHSATIGQPLRFHVGHVGMNAAPASRAIVQIIDSFTGVKAELHTRRTARGWTTEHWFPDHAGTYEVVATVQRLNAPPLTARASFACKDEPIRNSPALRNGGMRALMTAGADRTDAVSVTTSPNAEGLLVFLSGNEAPLGAVVLRRGAGKARWPVPRDWSSVSSQSANKPQARTTTGRVPRKVLLIRTQSGRPAVVDSAMIDAPDGRAILRLEAPAQALPGGAVQLRVRLEQEAGGAIPGKALVYVAAPPVPSLLEWTHADALGETFTRPGYRIFGGDEPLNPEHETGAGSAEKAPPWQVEPALSEWLSAVPRLWSIRMLDVPAEGAQFELDLPCRAGVYRVAVLGLHASCTAVAEALIDASRAIDAQIDLPARARPGDLVRCTLMLRNHLPTAACVRVRLEPLEGLHIVGLYEPGAAVLQGTSETEVALAPGQAVFLKSDLEVLAATAGRIQVRLRHDGGEQRLSRAVTIKSEPSADRSATIRLRRQVARMTPIALESDEADHADGMPRKIRHRWDAEPVADGAVVPSGAWLRVREEVEIATGIRNAAWRQDMPCTAAVRVAPEDVEDRRGEIGRLSTRTADSCQYTSTQRSAGRTVHEWWMQATRPGTGILPAPEVSADGHALPLVVEPHDFRITVTEARAQLPQAANPP